MLGNLKSWALIVKKRMASVTKDMQYAGFGIRAAALIIDVLLIQVISWVLMAIFFMLLMTGIGGVFFVIVIVVSSLLPIFVMPLFYTSSWQATPGKRIVKIYVTGENGNKLNYGRALYRVMLLPLISTIIAFVGMFSGFHEDFLSIVILAFSFFWFIPAAMTIQHTAVHDIIAKTRVLKGRP